MARKSDYTLPLLGLGGIAAIYLFTRKKAPADSGGAPEGGSGPGGRGRPRFPGSGRFKAQDHAMCFKEDSLNDADKSVIQGMVDKLVAAAPSWDTLTDARESAFVMTHEILQAICPSAKLPDSRNVVDEYLAKSKVLNHLWTTVYPKVWNMLTAAQN